MFGYGWDRSCEWVKPMVWGRRKESVKNVRGGGAWRPRGRVGLTREPGRYIRTDVLTAAGQVLFS